MACEGRASGVCPAELAQIASPAVPLALLPSRAASAQRKLFAGSLARPAKGASKGRTSGRLFSAASRARLPPLPRLRSPVCGLSSAPTRGTRTRDGAELATSKAATEPALSPLQPKMLSDGFLRGWDDSNVASAPPRRRARREITQVNIRPPRHATAPSRRRRTTGLSRAPPAHRPRRPPHHLEPTPDHNH